MKRTLALLAATALAAALVGAPAASGLVVMFDTQITTNNSDQQDASVWGDKIVYEDARDGGPDDIYMYDLYTGQESRITTDGADAWEPFIYGDTIVWSDERNAALTDVYMYDLSTGTTTRITDEAFDQDEAMIHGTNVAWADERNGINDDIWRYDLVTGAQSLVAGGPGSQDYPDVFGERIVYEEYDTPTTKADIHMHDLVTGTTTKITDEVADSKWDDDQFDPRIWGDNVVWYDYRNPTVDVYAYDIADGTEKQITSGIGTEDYPTVFKDRIVYEDDIVKWNIHNYDLFVGAGYPVTNDMTQEQRYPDVWGNKTVWEDFRNGTDWNIWMNTVAMVPDRAGGATRYDTAAMASSNHFANASTVVVATGAGFADALAASGLAGCYGGPLILTSPNSLSPAAATEIQRLDATHAVIVGGIGAVTPAVDTALQGLGLTTERLGGATRYDTAVLIADKIQSLTGANFEKTAFIARGDDFPDALSVSPLAYYNRFPILLTRPTALPVATQNALTNLDIETAVVTGGTGAVSADTKTAVDTVLTANGGAASERWAGLTRYETSVKVAEEACDRYWAGRGFVGVAVGNNFPDALAGGAAAGREFGVLILVQTNNLPTAAADFVTDSGNSIGWVEAFGGTGAVDDSVINEIALIIN